MEKIITKVSSVVRIEKQMSDLEPNSIRFKTLETAKNFKNSWFSLGQFLYTVYKDKLYREWGFIAFESYCSKELGIRSQTAAKLLKSYYFVEKDEPELKDADCSYESLNLLRLAKNNPHIDDEDYNKLKKEAVEDRRDPQEVGKQMRSMIKQAVAADPEEEHKRNFQKKVRGIISSLRVIRTEIEVKKFLPRAISEQVEELIKILEKEMGDI